MDSFIKVYDSALSEECCDNIIAKFNGNPTVYSGHAGAEVDKNIKNSRDLNVTYLEDWVPLNRQVTDAVFNCLMDYMKQYSFMLVGANTPLFRDPNSGTTKKLVHENFAEYGEPYIDTLIAQTYRLGPLNIQKYLQNEGGYPHWHSEICANDSECETLHRALFFIVYLNDVTAGGQTEFFYQQQSVTPKKGTVLIAPASFTHTHKGHMPHSNDKYIATSWIMFNRKNNTTDNHT